MRESGSNIAFIVGCQRSGTTWLQKLLATLPNVRTNAESYLFAGYLGPVLRRWNNQIDSLSSKSAVFGLPCYLSQEEFRAILHEFMLKLMNPMVENLGPGEIFVEKTPDHALFIPEIMELLPEARIIHILRDPRDVVASSMRISNVPWASSWASKNARKEVKRWVEHVEEVIKFKEGLSDDQFFELKYEDLHPSPIAELRKIREFLKMDWTDGQILKAVLQNDAEVTRKTGGKEIMVGGEALKFTDGILPQPPEFVGNARPGTWKRSLTLTQKLTIWRRARQTMEKAGYRWKYPW